MSIFDRRRKKQDQELGDDYIREAQETEQVPEALAVDDQRLADGLAILMDYRAAKSLFDQKVVDNYLWFREQRTSKRVKNVDKQIPQGSAWAFNAIANKHADAMDSYPEATFLPVEASDAQTADQLNTIVPAILARTNWRKSYDSGSWEKLIAGSACYTVLWDQDRDGIGEIYAAHVPILNVFWEPNVRDIQDGENFFNVELYNNDRLIREYPQMEGHTGCQGLVMQYLNADGSGDLSNKTEVVDWYYKTLNSKGQTVIQYCKFANGVCLFASEDAKDEAGNYLYRDNGYYWGGKFPFELDNDYNEPGTPYGFSDLDLMRKTQERINHLQTAITNNAMMMARPRWVKTKNGKINAKDLADWTQPVIEVDGLQDLSQQIQPITAPTMPALVENILQAYITELKETAGNRDFNAGGTTGGVTAASAINALVEQGNKLSRDKNQASYNCFREICKMIIDRMRQFYTIPRVFRIVGENGSVDFQEFDNTNLGVMQTQLETGEILERVPDFDITVEASKHSPYSRMQQNELALQLYHEGVFNPQNVDQARLLLSAMVFDGKDRIVKMLDESQSMLATIQQQQEMINRMAGMLGYGQDQNAGGAPDMNPNNGAVLPAGNADPMMQTRDMRTMQKISDSAEGVL